MSVERATARFEKLVETGDREVAIRFIQEKTKESKRSKGEITQLLKVLLVDAVDHGDEEKITQYLQDIHELDVATAHWVTLDFISSDYVKPRVVPSMIWLLNNNYEDIDSLTTEFIREVKELIPKEDDVQYHEFLVALYKYGFPRTFRSESIDYTYFDLIDYFIEKDDPESAVDVLKRHVNDAEILMWIWHDNTYQSMWPYLEKDPDLHPVHALENQIINAQNHIDKTEFTSWEDWLDIKHYIVDRYRSLGHYDAGISYAESALKAVPEELAENRHFFHLKMQLALLYRDQGSTQKAIEIYGDLNAANIEEHPVVVNSLLNYSVDLTRLGDYKSAIILSENLLSETYASYSNDFGKGFARMALVCSHAVENNIQLAREYYRTTLENQKDNFFAALRSALCLRDKDTVLDLYKARIRKASTRGYGLIKLSKFKAAKPNSVDSGLYEYWNALRNSGAFDEELEDLGRVLEWQLPAIYWQAW